MFSTAFFGYAIPKKPQSQNLRENTLTERFAKDNGQCETLINLCDSDIGVNSNKFLPDWHKDVRYLLSNLKRTNLSWDKSFPGRVKIAFYHNLVYNLVETLRDILHFIGHAVDGELLKCTLNRKNGVF